MMVETASPKGTDFAAEVAAALPALARLVDRDAVILRMADSVACAVAAEALAGSKGGTDDEGTIARIRRHAGERAGPATIWATGVRTSVDDAALRNAVAQRYLDYNDTYVGRAVTHPSDMIAALVALAEERKLGWDRLIASITVAYEVLCRMADVAQLGNRGFDGSTLTPIGTVAGAAWLVGLDAQRTAEAISIAALDAGTLRSVRQGRLSDWKAIASGRGAAKGLFAVAMVEAGCHSPERVFEGKDGFFERVSGPLTISAEGDARLPRTLIKKYPTQIFIQGLIELAQDLRPRMNAAAADIESVVIGLSRQAAEMLGGVGASNGRINRETADHSASFAVGAILLTGHLSHEEYETLLADPAVLSIMGKVRLEEDSEATRHYPRSFPARMTVALPGGQQITATQPGPRPMDAALFARKLDELWPAGRPRAWPWQLTGEAPEFPG
jgi:2-methylcitrate dehydratase